MFSLNKSIELFVFLKVYFKWVHLSKMNVYSKAIHIWLDQNKYRQWFIFPYVLRRNKKKKLKLIRMLVLFWNRRVGKQKQICLPPICMHVRIRLDFDIYRTNDMSHNSWKNSQLGTFKSNILLSTFQTDLICQINFRLSFIAYITSRTEIS